MEGQLFNMGKKIPPHIVLNGGAHHMTVVLHQELDDEIDDVEHQKHCRTQKETVHILIRQHLVNQIPYHNRENQVQSRHGKGTDNDPHQDFHIGFVVFHKTCNHSISFIG